MNVLVLDQTWQPASVINIRRAFSLLLRGKALPVTDEIVAIYHSPSTAVEIPAVIQVSKFAMATIHKGIAPDCSRGRILTRDDRECQFVVGDKPCDNKAATIDHLFPRSRGGPDTWENLVAACGRHNRVKGNRSLEEMAASDHWSLKRTPEAPKFMIRSLMDARKDIHPSWLYFLGEATT